MLSIERHCTAHSLDRAVRRMGSQRSDPDGQTRARVAAISPSKHDAVTILCIPAARVWPLEAVQNLLRLYIEGLTGREVEIAPLAAVPVEARITDGRTIHLPSLVAEFGDDDLDFRLYKVLGARRRSDRIRHPRTQEHRRSAPLTRQSPKLTPTISSMRGMPLHLPMRSSDGKRWVVE